MDFSSFDTRHYPTVPVKEGYSEWASTYEDTVLDAMDLRLLTRIKTVPWARIRQAADLACGTGRIGVWLRQQGVTSIDGIDLTAEMLEGARAKDIYRQVLLGDIRATPLESGQYDLVTESLADEHLPEVAPLYAEAARIARAEGYFVLVGYHPYFIMNGIPTHFDRAPGEPVTIATYVHLLSEHVQAARAAGWSLQEMYEGLIDEEWIRQKPKWQKYQNWPVSFALVWQKL
jgi:SAM-dependent methyltransferase